MDLSLIFNKEVAKAYGIPTTITLPDHQFFGISKFVLFATEYSNKTIDCRYSSISDVRTFLANNQENITCSAINTPNSNITNLYYLVYVNKAHPMFYVAPSFVQMDSSSVRGVADVTYSFADHFYERSFRVHIQTPANIYEPAALQGALLTVLEENNIHLTAEGCFQFDLFDVQGEAKQITTTIPKLFQHLIRIQLNSFQRSND